ncbi:LOW QUALITY PROTEIN: probable N-acetyltransferase 16 [Phocoena sinus]|uniref:LOW QUALITY PROTEIN: probable N-acetyltransferase 16 n=1 Tax=Phocoena sinus TaxID=42100 RepID=UPI0013C3EB7F|nr:LOW QUALITY PROTEIN: probable N-acetyltransferase 16 [Phocoena sinus]
MLPDGNPAPHRDKGRILVCKARGHPAAPTSPPRGHSAFPGAPPPHRLPPAPASPRWQPSPFQIRATFPLHHWGFLPSAEPEQSSDRAAQRVGRGEPFERRALAGEKAGRGPPNGLGPQIALGSVHVIDAGETAPVKWLRAAPWECGKGVARMLQRFCSQLVKRRHPGIKVARLTRDDQMGSRELKQYHLIAKQDILLGQLNMSALLEGLGARLAALRASGTSSPLPTEAVSEAGGVVARLLLSPSVQRDVLPGGTIIQDWQPYRPSESNLSLLAAKGLEWRVNSRARPRVLTLGTRPFPIPPGGNGTWRYVNIYTFVSEGAQVQSQLLWHLQRQAPRLVHLNVMCQLFLAPQLWLQLADFCQAGLGLELVKGYTEQYLLEADI